MYPKTPGVGVAAVGRVPIAPGVVLISVRRIVLGIIDRKHDQALKRVVSGQSYFEVGPSAPKVPKGEIFSYV